MRLELADDFIGYLYVTDQLDEFCGLKKEEEKCINCNTVLKPINNNKYYCSTCKCEVLVNSKTKKLTYTNRRVNIEN